MNEIGMNDYWTSGIREMVYFSLIWATSKHAGGFQGYEFRDHVEAYLPKNLSFILWPKTN